MPAPKDVIAYGIKLHEAKQDILTILNGLKKDGEVLAKKYVSEGSISNCDLDFARKIISGNEANAYNLGVLHSRLARISEKLGNDPVTNADFKSARGGAR